jgi:hypothetical protein
VSQPVPDPPLTRAALLGQGAVLALAAWALRWLMPIPRTEGQCITMLTVLTLGASCFVGCFQRGSSTTRLLCALALALCLAIAVQPTLWLMQTWGR